MTSMQAVKFLMVAALLGVAPTQIQCLIFSFPSFQVQDSNQLILSSYTSIFDNAIQLVQNFPGVPLIYMSGRALYKIPFRLRNNKGIKASFTTNFVLKIVNQTNPGGEGMAFILTGNATLPENSNGQWLGVTNIVSNGSSEANIVAIEFDTRKSYEDDIDDNHVGLDVNSIYSIKQIPLDSHGVNLSTGVDVKVRVQYDNENLSVFVGNDLKNPVLFEPLDLSAYLPENVFVGFSGSTSNFTEMNCVLSWEFIGSDIKDDPDLLWLWIMVPVLLLGSVLFVGIILFLYSKKKLGNKKLQDACPSIEEAIQDSSTAPQKFQLKQLRKATGEFNARNKLGKGGCGTVYKGIMRNKEVAIKRFSKNSTQGKQEFIAEVTTIGNLHHRNLVKLIGWCYENQEFLLVYEYMPNGSLDKFLLCEENSACQKSRLSWEKRLGIISGVGKALDYLHNGCQRTVLHRDIKASNIMLDLEFNARVGDFGLARVIKQNQQTHHSTKEIAGTPGYMAPESFHSGRANIERDVYAFGILVLEIACGKESSSHMLHSVYHSNILNRVWELYSRGEILDCADARLKGEFDREEMESVLILGLACCHPDPNQRPSMKTVLQVLSGEVPPPAVPTERPTFMWPPKRPTLGCLDYSPKGSQVSQFSELTGR